MTDRWDCRDVPGSPDPPPNVPPPRRPRPRTHLEPIDLEDAQTEERLARLGAENSRQHQELVGLRRRLRQAEQECERWQDESIMYGDSARELRLKYDDLVEQIADMHQTNTELRERLELAAERDRALCCEVTDDVDALKALLEASEAIGAAFDHGAAVINRGQVARLREAQNKAREVLGE